MTTLPVIGFLGGGKMAEAFIKGLLDSKLFRADRIEAVDIDPGRRAHLSDHYRIRTFATAEELFERSEVIIVAVKPQDIAAALQKMVPFLGNQLIISIAAGIPISFLAKRLRRGNRIVRVMPNTPALIGQGASAYCLGPGVGPEDTELVEILLGSIGKVVQIEESQMDAVTALSGSGPAYFFLVLEALIEAGEQVGLPRTVASDLAIQTAVGSAMLAAESGKNPADLRTMVTSPGGTTAAAIKVLENAGLRKSLVDAVKAAAERSRELAAQAEDEQ